MPRDWLKTAVRAALPLSTRQWVENRARRWVRQTRLQKVDFGNLRRLSPVSKTFGLDRGLCIDRYYIEKFLGEFAAEIRGRVLEIGDDRYTKKFGAGQVSFSDVLHIQKGSPSATIVADLGGDPPIPGETFDCIVFTQTLQFIYDFRQALRCLHRILKPGGVLLVTVAGISQVSRFDMERWGDYWRFTTLSVQRVFSEVFSEENLTIKGYGNVLAAVAFLHGIAAEELKKDELDYHDPDYQLIVAIRAMKQATAP